MSGPQRIGKYDIQAVIAKGTVSTVCRGVDASTRREVALKLVNRAAAQAEAVTRIQQSAAALARLRHPAIAVFHEVVEAGPVICIVSELIEGKSLDVLKKGAQPDLRRAWDIGRQLLDALGAAHAKGIFHGDLRPANIFLDAQARVRITDIGAWGLARETQALPHYAAPEHLGLGEISAATDLYQVAVIVYEMVTGRLPFTGTRDEIIHRLMQERPADPSSHTGRQSWQLDWVVQRALSKDPADRFTRADEFAEALRKGLEEVLGEPLASAPVAPPPAAVQAQPRPQAEPPAAVTPAAKAQPAAKVQPAAKAPPPQPQPTAAPQPQSRPEAHEPPRAQPQKPVAHKPALVAAAAKPAAPVAPPQPIPSSQAAAQLVQKAKAAAQGQPSPAPSGGDRRVRVLFVDDEERILAGLRALFRHDYNVFVTEDPREAMDLVTKHDIQIVVSDQRMPGMTGVELLRQVKEKVPQAVRVLLTGYSDLAALVGSINQGEIFRFVKKPWDNDELRQVLSDASKIAAELAEVRTTPPESPRSAGSILVVDPNQGLARGLQRLLAGRANVRLASSALEAVKLLDKEEIACIVADLDAGRDHLVSLFKLLKKQRPEILSILVTDEPDSELVVDLINTAQIFRFVTKPVNARELRTHVGSALRRFATFKKIPTLVEQINAMKAEAISA